ncbi:hypothetical protein [Azospirillum sp.]|uniref:hypothetical protein n=1 Tax=Azospirillum sp. TaxID=34012 RepID=UPI002D672DC2|nr:hypothetical protein [Azospirillum sp.]HYD68503.1 hypothetical protein [Azospirillum sp.]
MRSNFDLLLDDLAACQREGLEKAQRMPEIMYVDDVQGMQRLAKAMEKEAQRRSAEERQAQQERDAAALDQRVRETFAKARAVLHEDVMERRVTAHEASKRETALHHLAVRFGLTVRLR